MPNSLAKVVERARLAAAACRQEANTLPAGSDRAKALIAYADKLEAALTLPEAKQLAAVVEIVMRDGLKTLGGAGPSRT
jgi:hypothetical protein